MTDYIKYLYIQVLEEPNVKLFNKKDLTAILNTNKEYWVKNKNYTMLGAWELTVLGNWLLNTGHNKNE